jgi:hypothetical protein
MVFVQHYVYIYKDAEDPTSSSDGTSLISVMKPPNLRLALQLFRRVCCELGTGIRAVGFEDQNFWDAVHAGGF